MCCCCWRMSKKRIPIHRKECQQEAKGRKRKKHWSLCKFSLYISLGLEVFIICCFYLFIPWRKKTYLQTSTWLKFVWCCFGLSLIRCRSLWYMQWSTFGVGFSFLSFFLSSSIFVLSDVVSSSSVFGWLSSSSFVAGSFLVFQQLRRFCFFSFFFTAIWRETDGCDFLRTHVHMQCQVRRNGTFPTRDRTRPVETV